MLGLEGWRGGAVVRPVVYCSWFESRFCPGLFCVCTDSPKTLSLGLIGDVKAVGGSLSSD